MGAPYDPEDLILLRVDARPRLVPGLTVVPPERERGQAEQDFWAQAERRATRGPFCCGRETPDMPWSLGHIWVRDNGDLFFVGLRRSPVFSSFEDGASWLTDHPDGGGFLPRPKPWRRDP